MKDNDILLNIIKNKSKDYEVISDDSSNIVDAEFIKNLRAKLGVTQAVFASIFGISIKTIEKWEQGSIVPRDVIKKFLYIINEEPHLISYLFKVYRK